jgi:endonuclease YncB( thermonuclease family)
MLLKPIRSVSTKTLPRGIAALLPVTHLAEHVDRRPIECTPTGTDRYTRTLAVCRLGEENLNAWMVREGFALAFVKYSSVTCSSVGRAQRTFWRGNPSGGSQCVLRPTPWPIRQPRRLGPE